MASSSLVARGAAAARSDRIADVCISAAFAAAKGGDRCDLPATGGIGVDFGRLSSALAVVRSRSTQRVFHHIHCSGFSRIQASNVGEHADGRAPWCRRFATPCAATAARPYRCGSGCRCRSAGTARARRWRRGGARSSAGTGRHARVATEERHDQPAALVVVADESDRPALRARDRREGAPCAGPLPLRLGALAEQARRVERLAMSAQHPIEIGVGERLVDACRCRPNDVMGQIASSQLPRCGVTPTEGPVPLMRWRQRASSVIVIREGSAMMRSM